MLPLITDFVVAMIDVFEDVFANNLPVIVNAGIEIMKAIIQGIADTLPELLLMLPSLMLEITSVLMSNSPEVAKAGVQIVVSLIGGIISMLGSLASASLRMFSTIISKLSTLPAEALSIGKDLVEGLWDGIKEKSEWLSGKIDDFCDDIKDKIKKKFKIKSPSRVMRDEVGNYLAEGIGVGFEESMADVSARMQDAIPTNFDLNPTLTATNGYTASEFSYESMVSAFKEALTGVKVEMDDEEMGRFVDKTVSNLVFA
jgi:phage-related protein